MKGLIKPAFWLCLAVLVALELGARLFFAQGFQGRFEYGYNLNSGFAEHADGTVELFRAGGRRFHPQSFKKEPPPGTFRIFVIGDSVPRGPSLQGAYPWQLGEELRKRGVAAESLNLCLGGYGARRSRLVLEKSLQYRPSLIIWHINDSNEYEDEREYRRSQEFQGWHPRHWLMKSLIFRRLYEAKQEKVFWELIPNKIRQKFAASDADAQIAASVNPAKREAWKRRVEETTAAGVALARRQGIPVILVTQCRLETASPPTLEDYGLDALGRSLTGPGVYLVSMKEVLSKVPDLPSHFADTGHLRKSGHLILAKAIMEKIRQEGIIAGLPF